VGGLIAGALDLTQACILFGAKMPLVIEDCRGGRLCTGASAPSVLGVCLHSFIAFSAMLAKH